jgi:hypothetical protein
VPVRFRLGELRRLGGGETELGEPLEAPLEQSLVLEDLDAGHGHEALSWGSLISGGSPARGLREDAEPRSAGAKGRQGSFSHALAWHMRQAGGGPLAMTL